MNHDQTNALEIIAGVLAFGFLYRRREAIVHALRGTIIAVFCAGLAFFLLWKGGLPPLAAYLGALVVVVLVRRGQPGRSRYISARGRRQAVAKWEKDTGETFNRRVHELDHKLAHSRGGGNTEDNLQVLTRKQNRSKGARRRWKEASD